APRPRPTPPAPAGFRLTPGRPHPPRPASPLAGPMTPRRDRDVTGRPPIPGPPACAYLTDLVCDELALAAGITALRRAAAVVADTPTIASGITGYPVICKAGDSLAVRLARTANITVSAAAVRLAFSAARPGAGWLGGRPPAPPFRDFTR